MKRWLWQSLSACGVLFLVLFWAVCAACVGNGYILPDVAQTFSACGKLLTEGEFWLSFGQTALRALYAFLFSLLSGILFALVSYLVRPVKCFLAPVVSVLRTIPTMAIILILLVWTNPARAPVFVTSLVLFPTCYAAALASLEEISPSTRSLLKAYNVPFAKRIFKGYLPLSAPVFFSQTGAFFALGLKITVSAEVLAKTADSLGGMMQEAKVWLEMPELFALTLVVVVLGLLLEGGSALLYKAVVRWKGENRGQ